MTMPKRITPKRNKNLRIREHFFSWKKRSKSAPNFPLCCVQIPFRYGFLFHPHSYIAVFTIDFKRKIGGNKDKNLCHCCLRSRFTIALSIVKVQYVSIGKFPKPHSFEIFKVEKI